MVFAHEAIEFNDCAGMRLSARRISGSSKTRGAFFRVERGGMKLDELHVTNFGAGPEGEGDSVGGGGVCDWWCCGKSGSMPPVAKHGRACSNAGGNDLCRRGTPETPMMRPPSVSRLVVKVKGAIRSQCFQRMRLGAQSAQDLVRGRSSWACRSWLWLRAPSLLNMSLVPLRSSSVGPGDQFFNALDAFFRQRFRGLRDSTRQSPEVKVSCRCRLTSSSSLSAAAMPPWAS